MNTRKFKSLTAVELYETIRAIDYVNQDEFSKQYCERSASYLRSIRSQKLELPVDVLIKVADRLIDRKAVLKLSQQQIRLLDNTVERLAQMIVDRQTQHGNKVLREMLVRIVERISNDESRSIDYPPIIIC